MSEKLDPVQAWKIYKEIIGLEADLPKQVADRLRSEGLSEAQISQMLQDGGFMKVEMDKYRKRRAEDLPVFRDLAGIKVQKVPPVEEFELGEAARGKKKHRKRH